MSSEQPPEHGLRAVAGEFWPEMVPRRTEGTERYPMESTRYALRDYSPDGRGATVAANPRPHPSSAPVNETPSGPRLIDCDGSVERSPD